MPEASQHAFCFTCVSAYKKEKLRLARSKLLNLGGIYKSVTWPNHALKKSGPAYARCCSTLWLKNGRTTYKMLPHALIKHPIWTLLWGNPCTHVHVHTMYLLTWQCRMSWVVFPWFNKSVVYTRYMYTRKPLLFEHVYVYTAYHDSSSILVRHCLGGLLVI